jgi:hypothetical protein
MATLCTEKKMISTIEAYNAEISRIVTSIGDRKRILYRGQRNASWEIKSSLERHGKNRIACEEYYKIIDRYKPLLNPIIDEKFERKSDRTGYPFDFKEYEEGSWTLPEMEYLTYLRHHGFPTPLIDWTASPYVALFFACEDFIESKTCGKVYAYAPPKNRISGNEVPDLRHIGKYVEAGKRHFAQQSEYLIPTVYISEWEFIPYDEVIQNHENDHTVIEVEICNNSKAKLMAELSRMNINRYTMYLDDDSLIKTFADEWALQIA